jgi:hypothetical protein
VHPDDTEAGLEPQAGVRQFLMGSTKPTHAVDVSGRLHTGVESLRAHAAYLDGPGRAFDPAELLAESTAVAGRSIGVQHAVPFEVLLTRACDCPGSQVPQNVW